MPGHVLYYNHRQGMTAERRGRKHPRCKKIQDKKFLKKSKKVLDKFRFACYN
jgi:hypothetical protein